MSRTRRYESPLSPCGQGTPSYLERDTLAVTMGEPRFRTQALSLGRETDQIIERLIETLLRLRDTSRPNSALAQRTLPSLLNRARPIGTTSTIAATDSEEAERERLMRSSLPDRTRSKVTRLDTTRRSSRGQTSIP